MSFRGLACLLLVSFAVGQAAPPSSSPSPSPDVSGSKVGADDPVITLNDFCADPVKEGSACKTVITRAEFERLIDALQPGMPPELRLKVAAAYARNLRMAAAAEKRGLDKTPAFAEEMRYARLQLLAQDLDRALHTDAGNVSDDDLADYYRKNVSAFQQATLARIFVPHAKSIAGAHPHPAETAPTDPAPADAAVKASAEAMTKVAADLRARAASGEDPDKLQIEAYAEAGIERKTVETKLDKVRRTTLPPQHEAVMDLNPGEVSQVFSDPDGAHFIYKMIRKETLPLEEVKSEILAAISSQRYRDSTKSLQGDVVFNDTYFVPGGQASKPHRHGKPLQAEPPVQPSKTPE